MKKEEDRILHDTKLLLKRYRDVVWSLEVAVNRVNHNFFQEYGCDIEGFLDLSYQAGMELDGTQIEAQTRTIARSRNMLLIIDNAVDLLRKKHKKGELYYWILYYSYLSPQELEDADEIVDKISIDLKKISRRTFYRKRNEAVMQLGTLLWGYTSKECLEILEHFLTQQMA